MPEHGTDVGSCGAHSPAGSVVFAKTAGPVSPRRLKLDDLSGGIYIGIMIRLIAQRGEIVTLWTIRVPNAAAIGN